MEKKSQNEKTGVSRFASKSGLAIVLICGFFIIFTILLWRIGLFDFTGDEATAKVIASVVALLGALITAILAFAGVLLKQSIDKHDLQLKSQAEERLRMETKIRAVELLSTASGEKAPMGQKAGALFVLTNFKHIDFALSILAQMWPDGDIDSISATWVIDQALKSNSEDQLSAAAILYANAARLPKDGNLCWPPTLERRWDPSIPQHAKLSLIYALIKGLISEPYEFWKREYLNGAVNMFNSIRHNEPDILIKNFASYGLNNFLKCIDEHKLLNQTGSVSIEELRTEVENSMRDNKALPNLPELNEDLEKWVHNARRVRGH